MRFFVAAQLLLLSWCIKLVDPFHLIGLYKNLDTQRQTITLNEGKIYDSNATNVKEILDTINIDRNHNDLYSQYYKINEIMSIPKHPYKLNLLSNNKPVKSIILSFISAVIAMQTLKENRADAAGPVGVGYEAAESAFSPMQSLYVVPILAQSALLNTIPINNDLIGELQAYLESFVQLINPSSKQIKQIESNTSVLWVNLRINAQRAAGMFLYNQQELFPNLTKINDYDLQQKRQELGDIYNEELKLELIQLVNVSRRSLVNESLCHMRNALNLLHYVAYLQVPLKPSLVINSLNYINIPRLLGRAIVKLTFERPGPQRIIPYNYNRNDENNKFNNNNRFTYIDSNNENKDRAEVVIVVDGLTHPISGGNFIDLVLKKFYDDLPISFQQVEFEEGVIANLTILGRYDKGYIDPLTGGQRRIPLEVFREDKNRTRFTAVGAARNSAVFTKASPVQSFATYGAIGMYHEKGDRNGASSSIFWTRLKREDGQNLMDLHKLAAIQRLNNKYSLFAYVISGNDVLDRLRPGDIITNAVVEDGAWKLFSLDEEGKSEMISVESLD
eukprot:gene6847-9374_t